MVLSNIASSKVPKKSFLIEKHQFVSVCRLYDGKVTGRLHPNVPTDC